MEEDNPRFLDDAVVLRRQATVSALDVVLKACESALLIITDRDFKREPGLLGLKDAVHQASIYLDKIGMKEDAIRLSSEAKEVIRANDECFLASGEIDATGADLDYLEKYDLSMLLSPRKATVGFFFNSGECKQKASVFCRYVRQVQSVLAEKGVTDAGMPVFTGEDEQSDDGNEETLGKMSATDLFRDFHRTELNGLKSLRLRAISDCKYAGYLIEAMRDDDQDEATALIQGYSGYHSQSQELKEFGHLIEPVAISTSHPNCYWTGSDDPDDLGIAIWTETKSARSAHEAAVELIWQIFNYLNSKYWDLRPEMFPKAATVADLGYIPRNHWQEFCNELKPVSEFDFDALEEAIDKEHQRAIENCRTLVFTSVSDTVSGGEQSPDSDPGLPPSNVKSVNVPESRDDGAVSPEKVEELKRTTPGLSGSEKGEGPDRFTSNASGPSNKPTQSTATVGKKDPPKVLPECYVTLVQMSAIVNRKKRTLERLVKDSTIPSPDIKGGGGKPNEWRWSVVRPVLESEYGRDLPEKFPADRFAR